MAKRLNVSLGFDADTSKARKQIQDLQNSLDELMKSSVKTSGSGELSITKQLTEAQVAAGKLQTILSQSMNEKTGNLDLTRFSQSLTQSGLELGTLKKQLDSLGPAGQKAFVNLAQSIVTADVPLARTSKLLTEMWTTMKNTVRWQLSSSMLHGVMGAYQSAMGYAKDLDRSLNDIRIVTGQNIDEMARFAEQANRAAKALSTTTTEYTNASLIYFQQGLSDKEVEERTTVTIKMANAAGVSAQTVSDQMTAVWNNFDDGSKSLEYYADVMTALGAATASSTDEISQGLQKFASVAETVGLSYEYATAALATVTSETRESADVVGTAYKTLFARIQGLQQGETLDDGTDLNKYSEALYKVGINIKDTNGDMKDMDTILNEMGARWQTLAKDQQLALAQTVAGVRQYTQLVALMDNWGKFQENLSIAYNSEGTLQKQADIYAESWEAARKRVKAATEDLFDSLIDEKFFITVLNGFEDILNVVSDFIDSMNGLPGILTLIGSIMTRVFSKQITESINNVAFTVKSLTGQTQEDANTLVQKASTMAQNINFDTGTQAGDREGQALKDRLALQQQIKDVAQHLTEEQQVQLSKVLEINDAYAQQAIEAAKVRDAASQTHQDASLNIRKKIVQDARNDQGAVDQTKLTANLQTYQEAREKIAEMAAAGAKAAEGLKVIGRATKDSGESIKAMKNSVSELTQHLESVSRGDAAEKIQNLLDTFESGTIDLETFQKGIQEIVNAEDLLQDTSVEMSYEIEKALKGIGGVTAQEIEALTNSAVELAIAEQNSTRVNEAYRTSFENLKTSLTNFKGALGSFGENVTKTMQGISSFATGIQSLAGAFKTLSNPDLSFGEKVLQVTMSLSMAIPSLIAGLKALNSEQMKKNKQDLIAIKQGAIKVVQGMKETAVNYLEAASENEATKATWRHVAAKIAEKLASMEVVAIIGLLVAALLAFVAVVALVVKGVDSLVKAYNADAIAADEAATAAENLAKAYSDVKSEYDAMISTMNRYESAREGLDSLAKGTIEYKEALDQANAAALELIRLGGLIKDEDYTVENGEIIIKEEALDKAKEDKYSDVQNAYAASTMANAGSSMANAQAAKTKFVREDDASVLQNTINGVTAGVAAGTIIGSIPGAIAGAIAGALGGAVGTQLHNDLGNKKQKEQIDELVRLYDEMGEAAFESSQLQALGIDEANADYIQSLKEVVKATHQAAEEMELSAEVAAAAILSQDEKFANSDDSAELYAASGEIYQKLYEDNLKKYSETNMTNMGFGTKEAKDLWDKYIENSPLKDLRGVKATNFKADNTVDYEYYDKEGKKQKANIDLATMAAAVAAAEANDALAGSAEILLDIFNDLTQSGSEAASALKNIIAYENVDDISHKEFEALKEDFGNKTDAEKYSYLHSTFGGEDGVLSPEELKALGYESIVELKKGIEEAIAEGDKGWESVGRQLVGSAQAAFTETFASGVFDELSLNSTNDIADIFGEAFENGGSKGVESLQAILVDLFSDPNVDAEKLAGVLSGIDWQTTNVVDLTQQLQAAGIQTDGFADKLADLINLMKEGQNIGFDAAAEHYTTMKDMSKLKEGDSITEEQYQYLESIGINASEYFKLMGDGSYHLKEDAAEFYELVNSKSLDVFKSNIEAMYSEIGSVDGVMRRRTKDTIAADNSDGQNGYNQELVSDQLSFLDALNINFENLDTYKQIVAEGGELSKETLQEIQQLVAENKNRWDELPETIQKSAVELEKHQQALANSASTVDELNRLYEEQFITLEQYQEAVDEVMENEFEMEGLDPDAAEEVADAFRDMAEAGVEGMEALKNDEEAVKDATVRYMELNEAITDIYDNYKDYTQVLKDVRNATSKADRAMAANTDSAKKLKVSMAGLLGTTEDMIDADFLATIDPKDFEAAANGNADAIERIRNQFIQLKAEMYGIDFAKLKSELDAFNNGAYIDLNTTPFLNALIQAAVNAGQTAAEIEAMLRGFSIDADVTPFTEELWQATQQAQAAGQDIANATSFTTEVEQTDVENPRKVENPKFDESVLVTHKYGWNQVTMNGGFGYISYPSIYAEAHKSVATSVDTQEFTDTETVKGQTVKNNAGASGKGGVIVKNAHKAPAASKAPSAGNTSRPPVSSGGGGGGSSKEKEPSKPKKIDYTKQEEVVKRYKEIDDTLDDLADEYDRASMAADRLWGEHRLDALREQNKLIEEQQELLREKQKQAENYMKQDQIALQQAASQAGLSFSFDENGNISNYTRQMEFLYEQLANAEAYYNSLGTGEEQDAYEETILEPLRDKIKNIEDAMELYEESKELFEQLGIDIEDLEDQIMQNNYDIIMEGLELKISFNEDDLEVIDYYLSKIEDDFYKMAEAASLMVGPDGINQLEEYQASLEEYGNAMNELTRAYQAGEITEAMYVEGMKECKEGILDNLESLNELDKKMKEYYSETIEAAMDELSKYTDRLEHNTEVLEHYGNMMEILGKSMDYDALGIILQGQVDTIENEMKVAEAAYNMYQQQADQKKKLLNEAIARGDEAAAEIYQKEWEAATEAAMEAQSDMLDKTEEWAEAMRAVVENELAGLAKSLEQVLTGGSSFDNINTQLERAVSLQEEYLTTTNQIYETNKLMRTAQQEIDKTTNLVAKQRLKDFIKETNQLQDKSKLSKYELEIQEAKYNLLLAQIALEDAQDAKSMVRLQRDSEGNFGYIYTADQSKLAEAEQQLEDAQNELYNIGLEGASNYTEKYTETMEEMYDTLTSITEAYYNGEIASQEEYEAQMLAAQEYYYQQLENYQDLYGIALQTDTRVIQDSWTSGFRTMINNTETWKDKVAVYTADATTVLSNWYNKVEEISNKTGLDNIAGKVENVTDKSDELRDVILGNDGEPGVVDALRQELDAVGELTRYYATFRDQLQGTIRDYEELITQAINLNRANQEAIASSNAAVQAAKRAQEANYSYSSVAGSSSSSSSGSGSSSSSSSGGGGGTANKYKATYSLQGRSNTVSGYTSEAAARSAAESAIQAAVNALTGITFTEKSSMASSAKSSISIARYDTGGYTGSWGPYGKLGILDEKELILDKNDTANFLASMEVLERILEIIDLQAVNAQLGGALATPSIHNGSTSQTVEQSVHIEASFPGVQDRLEIEEAFNTLINKASQYANRK